MHVFISKDYKIYKIHKINKITISNMGLVRRYHYKGRNDVIKSCHAMITKELETCTSHPNALTSKRVLSNDILTIRPSGGLLLIYQISIKSSLFVHFTQEIRNKTQKACCFTNFKLSHAHVIHIYKYLSENLLFHTF